MATVLVTGFGPFGECARNPSGELARSLDGTRIAGADVVGVELAVSTSRVAADLEAALAAARPDLLLCTGVAAGRAGLSLERVAINVVDFDLADVDGARPAGEPIVAGGRDGIFASLPIAAILAEWRSARIPAAVSNTAGTYLCNQVFYLALLAGELGGFPAGFIHLPHSPESAPERPGPPPPTMELERMRRGLVMAIETCQKGQVDADLSSPARAAR